MTAQDRMSSFEEQTECAAWARVPQVHPVFAPILNAICPTAFAEKYGPIVTGSPAFQALATRGQREAFLRGYNDFPTFIERDIAAYASGFAVAEKEQEHRDEARLEARMEAADERDARGDWA